MRVTRTPYSYISDSPLNGSDPDGHGDLPWICNFIRWISVCQIVGPPTQQPIWAPPTSQPTPRPTPEPMRPSPWGTVVSKILQACAAAAKKTACELKCDAELYECLADDAARGVPKPASKCWEAVAYCYSTGWWVDPEWRGGGRRKICEKV